MSRLLAHIQTYPSAWVGDVSGSVALVAVLYSVVRYQTEYLAFAATGSVVAVTVLAAALTLPARTRRRMERERQHAANLRPPGTPEYVEFTLGKCLLNQAIALTTYPVLDGAFAHELAALPDAVGWIGCDGTLMFIEGRHHCFLSGTTLVSRSWSEYTPIALYCSPTRSNRLFALFFATPNQQANPGEWLVERTAPIEQDNHLSVVFVGFVDARPLMRR